MKLNTDNWKPFTLDTLFLIKKGKRLTKENYIDGDTPYVGASEYNNGITAHIGNDKYLHPGNVITVTYNGSIGIAFYQTESFWASDDVNVLYPKFNITPNLAIFLCTLINREKYRFNYGRKWFAERMRESIIRLPARNKEPDWEWIENYINDVLIPQLPSNAKSIWENTFEPKPILSNKITLNTDSWKVFKYHKVFTIRNGYYNKKPEHIEIGNIPFIGATEYDNGVTEYYSMDEIEETNKDERSNNHDIDQKMYKGNCVTVSNNGSVGCAFYQPDDFTCSHDVNVLYLIGREWNLNIAMFICPLIELEKFRWAFGRKWRPARMPNSEIKLPVDLNDNPNWEFMENYIKSLPYSSNLSTDQAIKKAKVEKGLSDEELVKKYESGGVDFGKTLKPILTNPK